MVRSLDVGALQFRQVQFELRRKTLGRAAHSRAAAGARQAMATM